ncbi:MAG: HD domain-containing protein [Patescibacteria group bacterium]|nr:HD domain-containing protein [Patescibacteria group bacterium]
MNLSPYVKKALYFAAEKHDGQYRKGGHVPYIVHPVQVAFTISTYTNNENVIAAALLHDVLEDCADVSLAILQNEFNDSTAQIVYEVSLVDSKKYKTWKEKKKAYLEKIKNASKNALMIVAADKMSNMHGYFSALRDKGDLVAKDFGGTTDEYFWYYVEVGKVLFSILGEHPIVKDYNDILKFFSK